MKPWRYLRERVLNWEGDNVQSLVEHLLNETDTSANESVILICDTTEEHIDADTVKDTSANESAILMCDTTEEHIDALDYSLGSEVTVKDTSVIIKGS